METRIVFWLYLMLTGVSFAQEAAKGERAGLIQTTATLYPSIMLNRAVRNNYVGGHLTYYFEDRFSFRGDLLRYIDAQTEEKYLKKHTEIMAGFGGHFGKMCWDPYVNLQFGLAAVSIHGSAVTDLQPTVGLTFGMNYHIAPYLYFYAEAIYRHMRDPLRPNSLDQLFFTGGLGFQLPTKRK